MDEKLKDNTSVGRTFPETDASFRSREMNLIRTSKSAFENPKPDSRGFVNSFTNKSSVNIRPTLFGRCATCCNIFFADSYEPPVFSFLQVSDRIILLTSTFFKTTNAPFFSLSSIATFVISPAVSSPQLSNPHGFIQGL